MKRFLALLMVVVMLFALAACGKDATTEPTDTSKTANTSVTENINTEESATGNTQTPSSADASGSTTKKQPSFDQTAAKTTTKTTKRTSISSTVLDTPPPMPVAPTSRPTATATTSTAVSTTGTTASMIKNGEIYTDADYEYRYNCYYNGSQWVSNTAQNGWGVHVLDATKTSYGAIPETIKGEKVTAMCYSFYKCTALTTAPAIPGGVTNLYAAFYGCSTMTDLSKVVIRANVTEWGFCFASCKKISSLPTIENAYIPPAAFQNCTGLKNITLPETIVWIGDSAFNRCGYSGSSFTIPASVKQIGDMKYSGNPNTLNTHTFFTFGTGSFKNFVVAEGNTNYCAVDGVLFNKDKTILVSYPRGKNDSTYTMPDTVKDICELSMTRAAFSTFVLSDAFTWYDATQFPENYLNTGNNLGVGLYMTNSVKNIEVHSTNTKYSTYNGLLLSKDGSTLLYIPIKNGGTGTIVIPNGVTSIAHLALHADTDVTTATEIQIPASLTSANDLTIYCINKQDWTITVDPNNPAFTVDSKGKLARKE